LHFPTPTRIHAVLCAKHRRPTKTSCVGATSATGCPSRQPGPNTRSRLPFSRKMPGAIKPPHSTPRPCSQSPSKSQRMTRLEFGSTASRSRSDARAGYRQIFSRRHLQLSMSGSIAFGAEPNNQIPSRAMSHVISRSLALRSFMAVVERTRGLTPTQISRSTALAS